MSNDPFFRSMVTLGFDCHIRDRSLFIDGGETFFLFQFLKLKAPLRKQKFDSNPPSILEHFLFDALSLQFSLTCLAMFTQLIPFSFIIIFKDKVHINKNVELLQKSTKKYASRMAKRLHKSVIRLIIII